MAAANSYRFNRLPLLPLLPAVLLVFIFLIVPGIVVLIVSFRPESSFQIGNLFTGSFSLEHYEKLLVSRDFLPTVYRSVIYVVAVVVGSVIVGMATALVLQRRFPARGVVQVLLLLPWAVPGVVVAILFLWMLNESFGIVNAVLLWTGIIDKRIGWLTDINYAMAGVLMPTIWKTYPFIAMSLIASMKAIPASLYEAADIDGANALQKFRHITLPSITPALTLSVIITALLSFKEFDFIYPLTGGGPVNATETLAIRIYNEAFRFFRLEDAAATGVLTTVVAALLAGIGYNSLRKEYFR